MASDYTVIEAVRHQFGDDPGRGRDLYTNEQPLGGFEAGEPFVGISHKFVFNCPSVDGSEMAILQFNIIGNTYRTNIIRVNGVDLPGGMYQNPTSTLVEGTGAEPLWHTQSLLVPAGCLREDKNILHIESTDPYGGDFDDFIVDNIVIWFKLMARPPRL